MEIMRHHVVSCHCVPMRVGRHEVAPCKTHGHQHTAGSARSEDPAESLHHDRMKKTVSLVRKDGSGVKSLRNCVTPWLLLRGAFPVTESAGRLWPG